MFLFHFLNILGLMLKINLSPWFKNEITGSKAASNHYPIAEITTNDLNDL